VTFQKNHIKSQITMDNNEHKLRFAQQINTSKKGSYTFLTGVLIGLPKQETDKSINTKRRYQDENWYMTTNEGLLREKHKKLLNAQELEKKADKYAEKHNILPYENGEPYYHTRKFKADYQQWNHIMNDYFSEMHTVYLIKQEINDRKISQNFKEGNFLIKQQNNIASKFVEQSQQTPIPFKRYDPTWKQEFDEISNQLKAANISVNEIIQQGWKLNEQARQLDKDVDNYDELFMETWNEMQKDGNYYTSEEIEAWKIWTKENWTKENWIDQKTQ
jgi:hypothetical protein